MIIVATFAIALIIVIISALTPKKKLNQEGRRESHYTSREEETPRVVEHSHASATQRIEDTSSRNVSNDVYSSLLYYIYFDNNTYGPFSLEQLKSYPLLEDTMITTNTLNGTCYEAKYFECLDELFRPNLPFRIDADGTIIRTE